MTTSTMAPFVVDQKYTGLVMAYHNPMFIADQVMPFIPTKTQLFKYIKRTKSELFNLYDTKTGRTGYPQTVTFSGTESTGQCFDQTLDGEVPVDDVMNAPDGYDPIGISQISLKKLLDLAREKRVADLVFAAGSYASTNRTALTGNDVWSVAHADANPIPDIETGKAACMMAPNTIIFGDQAWSTFRRNPYVVSWVYANAGTSGCISVAEAEDKLEMKVLVGTAKYNTAELGQTAAIGGHIWGKHCAMLYINPSATATQDVTACGTMKWGTDIAWLGFDSKKGQKGTHITRVGNSLCELFFADDLGYFIADVTA